MVVRLLYKAVCNIFTARPEYSVEILLDCFAYYFTFCTVILERVFTNLYDSKNQFRVLLGFIGSLGSKISRNGGMGQMHG
jgi:hypothetical protein